MKRPEQALQISCVKYLEQLRVLNIKPFVYFKIDNEGKRSVVAGAMAKRMGLRAGIPDLCMIVGGKSYFLEFKADKGKLSSNQECTIQELKKVGATVYVINNMQKFDEAITEILYK